MALPTITMVCLAYFSHYAISGPRGFLALENYETTLALQNERLSVLRSQGRALQHRIGLLEQKDPDGDLIEELARTQLFDGQTHQVAISRANSAPITPEVSLKSSPGGSR